MPLTVPVSMAEFTFRHDDAARAEAVSLAQVIQEGEYPPARTDQPSTPATFVRSSIVPMPVRGMSSLSRFAFRFALQFGIGLKSSDPDGFHRNDLLVFICHRQLVVLAGEIDENDIVGAGIRC